jgi:hypothetical protein
LEDAQFYYHPEGGMQPRHSATDVGSLLRVATEVERGAGRFAAEPLIERHVIERKHEDSPLFPHILADLVDGDATEPSQEGGLAPKLIKLCKCTVDGLLKDVFSVWRREQHSDNE